MNYHHPNPASVIDAQWGANTGWVLMGLWHGCIAHGSLSVLLLRAIKQEESSLLNQEFLKLYRYNGEYVMVADIYTDSVHVRAYLAASYLIWFWI